MISYKDAMQKKAESMSFGEGLQRYNKRLEEYGDQAASDVHGSRLRKHVQSLGLVTSALLSTMGGGLIGLIAGGASGAKLGGALGLAGGVAANLVGENAGYDTTPRSKKEQQAYTNSDGGMLAELLVPGVAGYQRGRRWRHVDDTVHNEFAKYKVSPVNG